jgi:NAD(P)-dependent dehydrogenase (short-subunit alcohol dehydrogenase family)
MSRPTRRNTTATVVGAGDFIGAAIARKFAAEGYTVFMGRRNGDKLEPLVAEIEAAGGRAMARSLDARDEDQVTAFFQEAEAHAPLELGVFNIGANVNFPLLETTSRVFRKVWEMACYAGFLSGREAARHMLPRGHGSVFFTGATAGLRGRSRNRRRGSSAPRACTSRTWSSIPASTPPGCGSGCANAWATRPWPTSSPTD